MDIGTLYNLLQKAQTFDEFMMYNNLIFEIEEENSLINNRNRGKINEVKSGKNKIISFINRNTNNK